MQTEDKKEKPAETWHSNSTGEETSGSELESRPAKTRKAFGLHEESPVNVNGKKELKRKVLSLNFCYLSWEEGWLGRERISK